MTVSKSKGEMKGKVRLQGGPPVPGRGRTHAEERERGAGCRVGPELQREGERSAGKRGYCPVGPRCKREGRGGERGLTHGAAASVRQRRRWAAGRKDWAELRVGSPVRSFRPFFLNKFEIFK